MDLLCFNEIVDSLTLNKNIFTIESISTDNSLWLQIRLSHKNGSIIHEKIRIVYWHHIFSISDGKIPHMCEKHSVISLSFLLLSFGLSLSTLDALSPTPLTSKPLFHPVCRHFSRKKKRWASCYD